MRMEHLKYEKCPQCGALAVSKKKEHQHTNGHWNEYVGFGCGAMIHYSPSYKRERERDPCPNSPSELSKSRKRLVARDNLTEFLKILDVDMGFKDRITEAVKYI